MVREGACYYRDNKEFNEYMGLEEGGGGPLMLVPSECDFSYELCITAPA